MWSTTRPLSSSSLAAEIVSPHTLHSSTRISLPLEVVPQELPLDPVDLREPPLVAVLAPELRAEGGAGDVAGERGADDARPQAEHGALVVLDAPGRRGRGVRGRGAGGPGLARRPPPTRAPGP